MIKNLPAMQDSIPGSGRSPGEENGNSLTPVFLPEKFHGQRNLMGYNPWGCKESDTIELIFSTIVPTYGKVFKKLVPSY